MKLFKAAAAAAAVASPAAAQEAPSSPRAPQSLREVTPGLAEYTDDILFGEVWRRPGLNPRDRSLVTLSSLVAGGRSAQMTSHVRIGLDNGLEQGEISGIITHLAFYSGWPNAVSALNVTHEVFRAEGVDMAALAAPAGVIWMEPVTDAQYRGH